MQHVKEVNQLQHFAKFVIHFNITFTTNKKEFTLISVIKSHQQIFFVIVFNGEMNTDEPRENLEVK